MTGRLLWGAAREFFEPISLLWKTGQRARREVAMKITRTEEKGKTVLTVEGWLDTPSTAALTQAIDEIEDAARLVLDLGGVQYICSSGLRAVLYAYKKMLRLGGSLSVVGVRGEVMEVFRLTGLDRDLDISARE